MALPGMITTLHSSNVTLAGKKGTARRKAWE